MNNKLKFCKIMTKSVPDDNEVNIYQIDSIEYCYETREGIKILTGKYSGEFIPNIFNNPDKDNICGWTEAIDNIKKFVATNDIDELREFMEDSLIDRHYLYDAKTKKIHPYADEYFMEDEELEEKVEAKNVSIIKKEESSDKSITQIYDDITKSVINQDNAIKKVLITIYGNQRIFNSSLPRNKKIKLKNNILLFGSTGTGKTEIIRQVAKSVNVPISIEDATRYTVAGYVGASIDDMIKNLVNKASNNILKAEQGILVIDEIDKKRRKAGDNNGVESEGVQYSLLKLIEGGTFNISDPSGRSYTFDSSLLTIVLCGAFSDLLKNQNESVKHLGFNNSISETKTETDSYTPEDFIKYGMIPELMGRMSTIVKTNDLSIEDIKRIITVSEISPLLLKKEMYKTNGVDLEYDDEFVKEIAKKVIKLNTGARGIKLILDNYFDQIDFEVLSNLLSQVNLHKDGISRKRKICQSIENKFN